MRTHWAPIYYPVRASTGEDALLCAKGSKVCVSPISSAGQSVGLMSLRPRVRAPHGAFLCCHYFAYVHIHRHLTRACIWLFCVYKFVYFRVIQFLILACLETSCIGARRQMPDSDGAHHELVARTLFASGLGSATHTITLNWRESPIDRSVQMRMMNQLKAFAITHLNLSKTIIGAPGASSLQKY